MLSHNNLIELTPLLLILSVTLLTNYIGDIFGNKIKMMFTNNVLLKHIIVILIIYTSLGITGNNNSPFKKLIQSLYLWILFIFLSKNLLRITSIVIFLMLLLFIFEDYIKYYKNTNNKEMEEKLIKFKYYVKLAILFLIIVGHILYINKQVYIFKDDFSLYKLYTEINK